MKLAIEYLKKQFEIFGIMYAKDFVIIPVTTVYIHDGYDSRSMEFANDLCKVNFYPQKNLSKKQFKSVSKYLKSNFNMNRTDHYFIDNGDKFILQVSLGDFYRNRILKDILDE